MSDKEKYNPMASAEMGFEDNYNQIDGIPNNGFKPSILERMKEYQQKEHDEPCKDEKSFSSERICDKQLR